MTTKSPLAAARSTVSSRPERSRSRWISSSTASSGTVGSRLPTSSALVLAERGLRAHADLDRELQRLALARQVAHVEVRLADRHDGGRVDRGAVPGGDRVAHRLVEHGVAADALDDDGRGRLAGAEAGDAHGAAELARGLRDALLDLLGGDLRLDADARLGELGDGGGDGNGHGRADNDTVAKCCDGSPPGSCAGRSDTPRPVWPTWRRRCGPRGASAPAAAAGRRADRTRRAPGRLGPRTPRRLGRGTLWR